MGARHCVDVGVLCSLAAASPGQTSAKQRSWPLQPSPHSLLPLKEVAGSVELGIEGRTCMKPVTSGFPRRAACPNEGCPLVCSQCSGLSGQHGPGREACGHPAQPGSEGVKFRGTMGNTSSLTHCTSLYWRCAFYTW